MQRGFDFEGFGGRSWKQKSIKKIKLLIGIARGALPRCPTTIPRRPQEAPRRPKTPQGRPKGGPGRANTPQDAPKTAPRRSRRLQKVSKIIQKSMFYNCEPSAASERAQRAERAIQEASRWLTTGRSLLMAAIANF